MSTLKKDGNGMIRKYWLVLFLTFNNVIFLISQLSQVFYTQFQDIYHVTNTQQGVLSSVGVVGTYAGSIVGGYLADRYNPKTLNVVACFVSGIVALIESFATSYVMLLFVYIMLSLSSMCLLNTAYMKCIRLIGTKEEQGRLFGFEEVSFAVVSLAFNYGFMGLITASGMTFQQSLRVVAAACIIIGLAIQLFWNIPALENYKSERKAAKAEHKKKVGLDTYIKCLKAPVLWENAMIFHGFSGALGYLFVYMQPNLAESFLLGGTIASAVMLAMKNSIRIIVSPIGGRMRDKFGDSTKVIIPMGIGFCVFCVLMAISPQGTTAGLWIYLILAVLASCCIFSINGLQYTIVEDAKVPAVYNGTMWGVIVAFGWSCGAYSNIVAGSILDKFGNDGYRYIWLIMAAFMCLSLAGTFMLRYHIKKGTVLGKDIQAELDAGIISYE